jgi:hypothetical protein
MERAIQGLIAIAALGQFVLLFPGVASTQTLSQTKWREYITLTGNDDVHETWGSDLYAPESLSDSLKFYIWGSSGSLSYGPPGPPEFTVHAYGKMDTAPSATGAMAPHAIYPIAVARGHVEFEFAVRAIATPPVPVPSLPVIIKANGATSLRGSHDCELSGCGYDGTPSASVTITVRAQDLTLMDETVASVYSVGQNHIVEISELHDISPDVVLSASVEAVGTVRVDRLEYNQWGEASASIRSDIEVSSDLIPGTDSKYSDYFEIEYSPGYWALVDPSPINPTTWGKIKALY